MNLNKITATAAMAGGLGAAALGIGAGLAQAEPGIPGPGPVPGPNVPGPDRDGPGVNGPGQGPYVPGQPICNSGPGVNCNEPGSPLPPGHGGIAPPPGHYNEPARYGLPTMWMAPGQTVAYPIVFNPDPAYNQWGVFLPNGQFVAYTGAQVGGGGVETPGT